MMKSKIVLALAATTALTLSVQSQAQTMCVFDLQGSAGPQFAIMKDYALAAKGWGATVDLKPYTDERVAAEDFKAGKCDAVAITGMRGRQFNTFTGSLDAIGAILSPKVTQSVMTLLANPKLAPKMVNGDYEIGGVLPLGAAYLLTNDRSVNTVAKLAGKKFAVLDYDKAQAKMIQKIGAQPVSSDITNFGSKFNNGQVDVVGAPALAFKPLELYKGLGTKGAVIKFPVLQVTADVILKKDKFPAGYGEKSRQYIAGQLAHQMSLLAKQEADIPAKYWEDIPANDKVGYVKLMRDARIELTKEGIYDKSMMSLLKKARCQADASSFECALNDE